MPSALPLQKADGSVVHGVDVVRPIMADTEETVRTNMMGRMIDRY